MKVENAVMPAMQQAMDFFGGAEDGPFVMVNLLSSSQRPSMRTARTAASVGGRLCPLRR